MHIDRNAMITVTVQRVQIEDIIKNILHLFLIKHETLFVQSEWWPTDGSKIQNPNTIFFPFMPPIKFFLAANS